MASYNIVTDTIQGCDPYSYEWFHERRHQTQFNSIKWLKSFNQNLEVYTYATCSGFLASGIIFASLIDIKTFLMLMGLVVVPYTILNILLELDAMLFGTWNWYKYHYIK